MRLRACLALLCLMLAGCQHLPDGLVIDLENRSVSVGPCRCALPDGPVLPVEALAKPPVPEPELEPAPAPAPEPVAEPDPEPEPEPAPAPESEAKDAPE